MFKKLKTNVVVPRFNIKAKVTVSSWLDVFKP